MDQERIDQLQEELRQKTDLPKRQIQQAEEEFTRAIEAEKNKEGGE